VERGKGGFAVVIVLRPVLFPEKSDVITVFIKSLFQKFIGKVRRIVDPLFIPEGVSDNQFDIASATVIVKVSEIELPRLDALCLPVRTPST